MYQPAERGFATYFLSMLADGDRNDLYERGIEACIGEFVGREGRAPAVPPPTVPTPPRESPRPAAI